eukprot:13450317-Ditylum_brightwellii.AAC.1
MMILSRNGILPRQFIHLEEEDKIPICASCIFEQAHKKPWRTKPKSSKKKIWCDMDDAPGKGTSTDQLVSHQPGLVLQVSGRLTRARVVGATGYEREAASHG